MKGYVKLPVESYESTVIRFEEMRKEISDLRVEVRRMTEKRMDFEERFRVLQKSHKDLLAFVEKVGLAKEAKAFLEATLGIEDYE